MTNVDDLNIHEVCNLFISLKQGLASKVREYTTNKDIPLEERWSLFKQIAPSIYTYVEASCDDPFGLIDNYLMGPAGSIFYIDRYQTVNLIDILDDLESKFDDNQEDVEYFLNGRSVQEFVTECKEELMNLEMWSFIWDW